MDSSSDPATRRLLVAYLAMVALSIAVTWRLSGALAPVWLALGLPLAFASSPRVRAHRLFGAWVCFVVPVALYLWRVADSPAHGMPWLLGLGLGGVGIALFGDGKERRALLRLYGFAVLVFLVAYFSGGQGRGGLMVDWLLRHGYSEAQAHAVTIVLRKSIHFTFYGTVGLAALWVARAAKARDREAIRVALLAAFALASFDELRQSGYASRTGSAWDVLLDLSGAAVFVGLSSWRGRKRR